MTGWRRRGVQELFTHPLFDLERHELERDGDRREALVIKAPDWINVIPLTDDGRVVLIRQWRHGIAAPTLEIPGGMVDAGEEPAQAAARELLEETGYRARHWRLLGEAHPNPAFLANRITTWVASGLEVTDEHREVFGVGDETITVEPTPLADIPRLVRQGVITHALVLAAFYLLEIEDLP